MILNCEIAVSAIIRAKMMGIGQNSADLLCVILPSSKEPIRKTAPPTSPIRCSAISDRRTTIPARCGDGSSVNEICATIGRKTNPPIHTPSDSSIKNRAKFIS